MDDISEKIAGILILVVVGATIFFNFSPAGTLNGKDIIPPDTKFHFIRTGDQVDSTVKVTNVQTGQTFTVDSVSGQYYQDPDQKDSDLWRINVSRERYMIDPALDIGTFAAAYQGGGTDGHDGMAVGIRYSPVRVLYGTVAPDFLATNQAAGLGISVYPPPDYFGKAWSHIGLGVGRLWDYSGGSSDNILYCAFSTRF